MSTCSVDGCTKTVLARQYCSKHYTAWRKHGDPLVRTMAERGAPMKWLQAHVSFSGSECLPWPFKSRYASGYGSVFVDGKLTGAHRAMCRLVHGEPPVAKPQTAHACGNKLCCNPSHIRWATQSENELDKAVYGKSVKGSRNGCSKLTEEEVLKIYARKGSSTQSAIARDFSVTRENVRNIHSGKTWGWLTKLYRMQEAA